MINIESNIPQQARPRRHEVWGGDNDPFRALDTQRSEVPVG